MGMIAIAVAGAGVLLAVLVMYNRLVRLRNRCDTAWSQVDVQLRRRYDLIPNLSSTVKSYAVHERGLFEEVAEARSSAQAATTVGEQANAESTLTQLLGRVLAVAEAYPDLRASENYARLQESLEEAENKIAVARQVYNDTVLTYRNARQQIPSSAVAAMFRFSPRGFFEIEIGHAARGGVAVGS